MKKDKDGRGHAKEANSRSYELKDKDRELLKLADKANDLDKLMTNIRYYTKADIEKEAKEKVLSSMIKVYTMEDLLYKYRDYSPVYYEKDNSIYFSSALPMEVFILFKQESARFNLTDLVIGGGDPEEGYYKCRKP
jgi:hypothetical protein